MSLLCRTLNLRSGVSALYSSAKMIHPISCQKKNSRIKYTMHESHINNCMKVKEDLMIRIGKRIERTSKWERESRKGKVTSFRSLHACSCESSDC